MEKAIAEAKLQMVDSYVKDSYMKIHNKYEKNKNEIQIEMEVRMSKIIKTNDEKLEANLMLIQKLKIVNKEDKKLMAEIGVQMIGKFMGNNLTEEEFFKMVKYNGTPTLSQLIRSYVITITSVGGLEPIRIPMINFVEFFNNAESK